MIVRAPTLLGGLPAGWALCVALLASPAQAEQAPADPGLAPVAPATPRPFRCDGTDSFFFDELNQAGTVGYGETWDGAVCDQGIAVYAEGATSRWAAFKRPRRPVTDDEQALAMVLPLTVGGGLALIFGGAAALSLVSRLRKRLILEAPCPSCSALLPVEASEGGAQLFCPMCGAACAIIIQGRGKTAHAHASPLS